MTASPDLPSLISEIELTGYCKIQNAYSASDVEQALILTHEWRDHMSGREAATVPYLNRGHPMVYNLQNKSFFYLQLLFQHEVGQALLRHFLNDPWYKQIPQSKPNYILRSFLARTSNDALPMHIDSFIPFEGEHVTIMQYAIVLEPMTEERGGTVFVPGSHRSGRYVTQEDRHSAVPVEANPGDLLIWDSRVWHGTTANQTTHSRWALIATFSRWWIKQAFQITEALPEEIFTQLNEEQKAVMGYCSLPYRDERQGIDMKRGFDEIQLQSSRTHW